MIGSLGRANLALGKGKKTQTVVDALVLPNDATAISATIYQIHADNKNPRAEINGVEVYNIAPTTTLLYKNDNAAYPVSALKAGSNLTLVEAVDDWGGWSSWFSLRGSYRANSCNAVFKGVH